MFKLSVIRWTWELYLSVPTVFQFPAYEMWNQKNKNNFLILPTKDKWFHPPIGTTFFAIRLGCLADAVAFFFISLFSLPLHCFYARGEAFCCLQWFCARPEYESSSWYQWPQPVTQISDSVFSSDVVVDFRKLEPYIFPCNTCFFSSFRVQCRIHRRH